MNRVILKLLVPSILLSLVGLSLLYTLDVTYFRLQSIFVIVSIAVYFLIININFRVLNRFSFALYCLMVILLLISFIVGIETRGAVRWIELFGIRIQFSEIFKPFFILFFSLYLTKNDSKNLGKFLKTILLFSPIFILIIRQPDLGNALIYLFLLIFMLFTYGFPKKYFVFISVIAILISPFLFSLLHDYQKQRIYSYFNLNIDPFGTSYNAVQTVISIGSGEIIGKGYGQATQSILQFLPERHTDFIFATHAETMGAIGVLLLFTVFGYLLWRIYVYSTRVTDEFSNIFIISAFYLILLHIFFNVGMNLAILPIVGITLPFLSYGGSSLLTNFTLIGIISSLTTAFSKKTSVEIK